MHEVLAFSAILTAVAFLISSFAVFLPEYRAAQKREAAGTTDGTEGAGMGATAAENGAAAGAAAATRARAGTGQSGNRPKYDIAGPEDMKRYLFNPSARQMSEEEEREHLALAAGD
ncbi:MAG: hypothetical protein WA666_12635 [Nitrospirota bacterium]